MKTVLFWILVGSVALVAAETLESNPCTIGRDANILSDFHEITVDPCPGAEDGEPCELYRGSNATVTLRFTPSKCPIRISNFSVTLFQPTAKAHVPQRMKSSIAWVKGTTDLAFRAMRPDACLYMPCPVRANEETTFSATLSLGSTLPVGMYPLKVKLQELRGRKRVFACQLFSIRLTDPE